MRMTMTVVAQAVRVEMVIVYGYHWRRLVEGQTIERWVSRVFRVSIGR